MINIFRKIFLHKDGENKRGYITLVSVLVLGAAGLSITLSMLLLGIDASKHSLIYLNGNKALSMAEACAEEALEVIKENSSFAGSGNLTFGGGSCSYDVINTGGSTRSIASSGSIDTIVRRISIIIDAVEPEIHIASWQEVADF